MAITAAQQKLNEDFLAGKISKEEYAKLYAVSGNRYTQLASAGQPVSWNANDRSVDFAGTNYSRDQLLQAGGKLVDGRWYLPNSAVASMTPQQVATPNTMISATYDTPPVLSYPSSADVYTPPPSNTELINNKVIDSKADVEEKPPTPGVPTLRFDPFQDNTRNDMANKFNEPSTGVNYNKSDKDYVNKVLDELAGSVTKQKKTPVINPLNTLKRNSSIVAP